MPLLRSALPSLEILKYAGSRSEVNPASTMSDEADALTDAAWAELPPSTCAATATPMTTATRSHLPLQRRPRLCAVILTSSESDLTGAISRGRPAFPRPPCGGDRLPGVRIDTLVDERLRQRSGVRLSTNAAST